MSELGPGQQSDVTAQTSHLESFVVEAFRVLQDSYLTGDMSVQVAAASYGGSARLASGEELRFVPELPQSDGLPEVEWDSWRQVGFTDDEIKSGISILMGSFHDGHGTSIDPHVFVSGLFDDTSDIRVLRRQEDDVFAESTLLPEEKAAMIRIAFLSQLPAYIAERYQELDKNQAVRAFVSELLDHDPSLDPAILNSMLHGTTRRGNDTQRKLVAGTRSMDDLVGDYRKKDLGGQESQNLARTGEYFTRIVRTLGTVGTSQLLKIHDTPDLPPAAG